MRQIAAIFFAYTVSGLSAIVLAPVFFERLVSVSVQKIFLWLLMAAAAGTVWGAWRLWRKRLSARLFWEWVLFLVAAIGFGAWVGIVAAIAYAGTASMLMFAAALLVLGLAAAELRPWMPVVLGWCASFLLAAYLTEPGLIILPSLVLLLECVHPVPADFSAALRAFFPWARPSESSRLPDGFMVLSAWVMPPAILVRASFSSPGTALLLLGLFLLTLGAVASWKGADRMRMVLPQLALLVGYLISLAV